jgi:hypothetical protein
MRIRLAVFGVGLAALLSVASPGSASARDLYLNHYVWQLIDDEWVRLGYGCSLLPQRADASDRAAEDAEAAEEAERGRRPDEIEVAADWQLIEQIGERSATVQIYSESVLVDERVYKRGFLRSGRLDRFIVNVDTGAAYELEYWGDDECVTPE